MHEHVRELEGFIMSGIPAIWCQTYEEQRTIELLSALKSEYSYSVLEWNVLNGGKTIYATDDFEVSADMLASCMDPISMIQEFGKINHMGVVLILHDFHKFIENIQVIRAIKEFVNSAQPLKHIICMSHRNAIPEELEKDMLLAQVSLPGPEDLNNILTGILQDNEMTDIEILPEHIKAVQGLTHQEAKNAYALTLANKNALLREELENFKLEAVKKSGMMEIFPAVPESELGGLDALKTYMRLRSQGFDDENLPTPTGILLMGLPGGGKSLSAKVIASILKMPLIKLDIASLKSKYVGESESKMGQALKLIDAVAPAVVWLDK